MTTFDYPAFLAARLDEQEAEFKGMFGKISAYMMADIAAKRAILAELTDAKENQAQAAEERDFYSESLWQSTAISTLVCIKHLCRPFADHPDHPRETE